MASPQRSASLTNKSTCACKKRLVPNWRMGNAVNSFSVRRPACLGRRGLSIPANPAVDFFTHIWLKGAHASVVDDPAP
jgi:hypothetical protein